MSITGVKDQLIPIARASCAMMRLMVRLACRSFTAAKAKGLGTWVPTASDIRLPSKSAEMNSGTLAKPCSVSTKRASNSISGEKLRVMPAGFN